MEYHKIQSVFKRDPATGMKRFLIGEYSVPEIEYLKDNIWFWDEKIDGTNIRILWDGNKVIYGGRTDNAQIPATLIDVLNQRFPIEKMQSVFGNEGGVILYGEGFGAKIQAGGAYKPDGQDFILFDVRIGGIWLEKHNVNDIAKKLEILAVPRAGEGTISQAIEFVQMGFRSLVGTQIAEGLVLRPKAELLTRRGHRIITKIKHRDFA